MAAREAVAADVPGVLALVAEVYREYDCVLDAERDEPHLLTAHRWFGERGGTFWVVEHEGRIRATCGVFVDGDTGELRALYVHPCLRRQGWGRRLTEQAVEWVRRAGCGRMVLWSDTRFEAAHRLYEGLGFHRDGERQLDDANQSREFGFTLSHL